MLFVLGTLLTTSSARAFIAAADIATLIGADVFYENGITGQDTSVANIEAGHFWTGHTSLSWVDDDALYTPSGGVSSSQSHATAVAQIIGGRDTNLSDSIKWNGIAYGTNLYSGSIATALEYDTAGNETGSFSSSRSVIRDVYSYYMTGSNAVDVINSSWGSSDSSFLAIINGLAAQYTSTTVILSAGNSGSPSGSATSTVATSSSGLNAVSVGALNAAGTGIADYSSRGTVEVINPQTRKSVGTHVAVQIVTYGTDVMLAYTTTNSGNIYEGDGTSFAAPVVAGAASLLVSAAKSNTAWDSATQSNATDSRVIKAILMNSASKLTDWDNGQATVTSYSFNNTAYSNVVVTTQALDTTYGAGALNLTNAYNQYLTNESWALATIESGFTETYTFNASVSSQSIITVTLTWYAEYNTSNTYSISALTNLDLQVWSVDGEGNLLSLLATSATAADTTEHLSFLLDTEADTSIALCVVSNGAIIGTQSSVTYALAWDLDFVASQLQAAIPELANMTFFAGAIALGCVIIRLRRRDA